MSVKLPLIVAPHRQGQLSLLLWCVLAFFLLRHDLYGLDEGAAKSLLMSWSIADQVASSVITFGTPDLRTLLYLPSGFLWTGNVFAAKVLTVLLVACAVWLLFAWKKRNSDPESALLASGLLLVSPMTLEQIDSLSPGIYLMAAIAFGAWLDEKYRAEQRLFGGWYFAQLLVCAFSVSLHPAGLAYPLSLLWSWRDPGSADRKHQKYMMSGVIFVTLFILLLRMLHWGDLEWLQNPWSGLDWFQNPVNSLASILTGTLLDSEGRLEPQWLTGGIILAVLIVVVAKAFRVIWPDLIGRTLLLGLALGLTVGDQSWGIMALALILYYGIPVLLRSGSSAIIGGFFSQRGWVLLLVFICLVFFMHADRKHYEETRNGMLSAQDQLIKSLAEEAEIDRHASELNENSKDRPRFIVASQWPSRTMIACKCDTFPLPPAARDPQTQLVDLHGVTHILLDPKQTANVDLARNLSLLGGAIETTSLQPGGVLLHVKQNAGSGKHE
jgi:cbb3-type cytochrome oxidase subunit 3